MSSPNPSPAGHTPEGGVLVGSDSARRKLVLFEDPQCPFCRQSEDATGDVLRREISSGSVSVEYRMRSFLGPESVRANNALALAAEAGHFDQLRRELFAHQPAEQTGGFTTDELVEAGRRAGLTSPEFAAGVQEGRYADWVVEREGAFLAQDPDGTSQAQLDGQWVNAQVLYDPEALGALVRG